MGVMSCTCNHCSNVMCDTYVSDVGYICNECKSLFKNWLKTQPITYIDSDQFIKEKLKEFSLMDTYQHNLSEIDEYVDNFFKQY